MYVSTLRRNLLVRFMSVFLLWFSFSAFSEIDQIGKQKVTVIAKNETLESVFKQIERQTGLRFMYASDVVDVTERVTVVFKQSNLDDVLSVLLLEKKLDWSYRQSVISLRIKEVFIDTSLTKNKEFDFFTLRGRVLDAKGNPVPGATLQIKGSQKGTRADGYGNFILDGVSFNNVLVITSIGFEAQEMLVKSVSLVIRLKATVGKLDEAVIIGYGTSTQRFYTGNVTSVKAEEIERNPVSDPLLALQGRVPGMTVSQTTGLSGGEIKVQIRGVNSIRNGTQPLFIVDGVPYSPNVSAPPFGGFGALGTVMSALNFINPNDIERIDVLKDADATAIYGSRGANGVILVTTKKGMLGAAKVEVSVTQGIQNNARKRKMLNTNEYLAMRHEAFRNDDVLPDRNNAPDLLLWDTTRSTDWQNLLIGGSAHYTDGQASMSGGAANVQYLIGANYHRETTVFPGEFYSSRGGTHFNLIGNSLNQIIKTSFTGSYTVSKTNFPGGDFASNIDLPPNAPPVYNDDGTLNWAESTWENPFSQVVSNTLDANSNNIVGNLDVSFRILTGLEFKANIGYNELRNNGFSANLIAGRSPREQPTARARAAYTDNKTKSWISEPQLTYRKSLARNDFNVLLGMTLLGNKTDGQYLLTDGILQDALVRYPAAAASYFAQGVGSYYKYLAFFGRLGYSFSDKYLLNFTIRRDGSSRFGPNKQFATFGSVGAAWIFSQEQFFHDNFNGLSFGKLRASWGVTGNDQIGDYQYLDQYEFVDDTYQGIKGLKVVGLFNPDFEWEKTNKMEIAIETGFLKDKVLLNASYYGTQSSNQLLAYQVPSMSGNSSVVGNLPVVIRNQGVEIILSTQNIHLDKLQWNASVNFSFNKNKIIKDDNELLGRNRVGKSLSEIPVYKNMGVEPSTGKYLFSNSEGKAVYSEDADGFAGFVNPTPAYFGGIQNGLSYKGVRLDFLFQFVAQKAFSGIYRNGWMPGRMRNQSKYVLRRWNEEGDNTSVQRYSQDFSLFQDYNVFLNSDAVFTNASYLRCKNVSLSWNIPRTFFNIRKEAGITCRVYLQAQNLFTVTNYSGWDPETASVLVIPPMRVLTVGAQISL